MAGEDELKNLVDEFLYLVEVGSGSAAANESELEPVSYTHLTLPTTPYV